MPSHYAIHPIDGRPTLLRAEVEECPTWVRVLERQWWLDCAYITKEQWCKTPEKAWERFVRGQRRVEANALKVATRARSFAIEAGIELSKSKALGRLNTWILAHESPPPRWPKDRPSWDNPDDAEYDSMEVKRT